MAPKVRLLGDNMQAWRNWAALSTRLGWLAQRNKIWVVRRMSGGFDLCFLISAKIQRVWRDEISSMETRDTPPSQ